jgi:pimeloyl-ACP methyl ester carboxylesterase
MKKYSKELLTLVISFALISNIYSQPQPGLIGNWEGKLQLPAVQLRILLQLKKSESGNLAGRMASPDQGANNIPVESVSWRNDSLVLNVKAIGGTYIAKISADSLELSGHWKQGGAVWPMSLKKVAEIVLYSKRLQEPQKPFPYTVEDVTYQNKAAGITIGGTLTLPQGKGPFPVALLITGSGPQNRDEEIMGHKPFLVLADHLTKQGIAVLRVDDRGVGQTSGDASTATSADNTSDVVAGIDYLKSRADINLKKIGLIGHSEGGMIAPMVASQSRDISFIVLLAGVGLPGDKLHRRQSEDIMHQAKVSEEEINKALILNDRIYMLLKAEKDNPSIDDKLTALLSEMAQGRDVSGFVKAYSSPWFRYFINFNPEPYLQKVKCPVLALNGSKDIQVAAKENLAAIETAVKSNGNKKVTTKEIPDLNHLFQTATTGSMDEYGKIEETFSPVALKIISDWITGIVK